MGGVDVRRASVEDYEDMAALRWRWRSGEGGETNPRRREWTDAFVRWLHEHSASHIGVVATDDEQVVGEAWLAIVDRVPTVAPTPPENLGVRRSGYLQAVYVTPEHRGAGIGTQIVDLLVAEARRRELAYVSVHPSERSFSLYRRAGFTGTNRVLQLRF